MNSKQILSDIVVYSKYAKYLPGLKRRETWSEIVQRNADMHAKKFPMLADEIYRVYALYVLPKLLFPSMRSLQFAGKPIERNPSRIFNCTGLAMDNIDSFSEIMFLLLGGSGVGISVQKEHVDKLPTIKQLKKRHRRFLIPDTLEGWAEAIKVLMESYFHGKMEVVFDYSDIRVKGTPLKTAGGLAPGPQPLKDAIHNIRKVLDEKLIGGHDTKLSPIDVFDITCYISNAVLAGGIRRSAIITLFSSDDLEMLNAKSGNWWELNPQRGRSNNSAVVYRNSETAKEDFDRVWEHTVASGAGEPGLIFSDSIEFLVNPCAEISLRSNGACNLTEIIADGIESQEDLNDRARAASFLGTLQAAYTDFHYLRDVWRKTVEEDALLGVSMTGIASGDVLDLDLEEASDIVRQENERVAEIIGINKAKRLTSVKPSGTSSLVAGTSSGIHAWFGKYYIRRMRLAKTEPIYEYLKDKLPSEFIEDEFFDKDNTAVLSIPIKAPDGAITRDETVWDLLDRVRKFNVEWIASGHIDGANKNNVSATISIKDEEWEDVGKWMWENRETFTGLSVLPYNGGTYKQMPFEEIEKEEYERLSDILDSIEINLVDIVEERDNTDLGGEAACAGGNCETTRL